MARVDDFIGAKNLAAQILANEKLDDIALRSGFEKKDEKNLIIPFLNRVYEVEYPGFEFFDKTNQEEQIPLQEQVLIMHYLKGSKQRSQTGSWIAYREIQGAAFYFNAFVSRAVNPLKQVFGENTDALKNAAQKLNARSIEYGDVGLEFDVFPNLSLQIVLWQGDEEFPTEANILFEEHVGDMLSPEDAAWVASLLVYRLMALSR